MNKYFNPKLIKRNKRYNVVISARKSGLTNYLIKSCNKKKGLIIRKYDIR